MFDLIACILNQHDLRLVGLALVVAATGSAGLMWQFERAQSLEGLLRLSWLLLASVVGGGSIWCTHFISMLGYYSGARVELDPVLTIISLIISITGVGLALLVAVNRQAWFRTIGGVLLGLTICATHYVGMEAYHIAGTEHWNTAAVGISVIIAVTLGGIVFERQDTVGTRRARAIGATVLVLAITGMHFTGMAALAVMPMDRAPGELPSMLVALALATAIVGFLIISAGALAVLIDRTNNAAVTAFARSVSLTDPLTGMPNLDGFEIALEQRLEQSCPEDRYYLAIARFKNFESIRERYGRHIGDEAIRIAAEQLLAIKHPDTCIAKSGPAEFCALIPVGTNPDSRQKALQVVEFLSETRAVEGCPISLAAYLGVAIFPDDSRLPEDLITNARLALARAEDDPIERIGVYDERFDMEARRKRALASDISGAAERGELELFYQPQAWIADRSLLGFEALLRWNHPVFGTLTPDEFIPLAERSGDIIAIGTWVIEAACKCAASWPRPYGIAVNVSPMQLRQPRLVSDIHLALLRSGLSPSRLEIEVTETLLIENKDLALHVMRQIRAIGVKVALDDFGTGYSSLNVLREFPFDKIKLDKSFVRAVDREEAAQAILRAVLSLGRDLSIPVLVEGVETEAQLSVLASLGCRKVQGYLTGRPIPAAAVADRIASEGLDKRMIA